SLVAGNLTENDASVTLRGSGAMPQLSALAVNAGSFTLLGGASFTTAGDLQSSGTILVGPGSILHGSGNLNLGAASNLTFQIAGTPASGNFGKLTVHGATALAGNLNLAIVNGFGPL